MGPQTVQALHRGRNDEAHNVSSRTEKRETAMQARGQRLTEKIISHELGGQNGHFTHTHMHMCINSKNEKKTEKRLQGAQPHG